jgi:alpha-glucosidase (family GH31 glycosyl hydrolase)
MTNPFKISKRKTLFKHICICFYILSLFPNLLATGQTITHAEKVSKTMVRLTFSNSQNRFFDFYSDRIFRLFQTPKGRAMNPPEAKPEASILVQNPRTMLNELNLSDTNHAITLSTAQIQIKINKQSGLMNISDLQTNRNVLEEIAPVEINQQNTTLQFREHDHEYFYGGGVQNGRFSHRGQQINIVNENNWTDGGVASPNPFYWSTNGYGLMFYTFKPGHYDFGATQSGIVSLQHNTDYLDIFIMVDNTPGALLKDYYQLTGNPILLPKFGFYEGHLNAYNRDFWKESSDKGAILFEDGKRYNESSKDEGGATKESLNGEKNNYQFSARAVIDRYEAHDMPLGWILPNDGYGAGYGQTNSLDGNIQNLKDFGVYARKHGVEIGLWTQSDLHPVDSIKPLLQRDIEKEIGIAGVRVLKTDVAWVGDGYSFGLNGIADVANLMPKFGSDARPMIISLDGWAGTQRYAGIWTGDQTGGKWEYIRFHIPTYIGSGLSGIPNITSDMDGIFGGKQPIINIRDFQWKTFTPMQLNMDGWGSNEKYPHALGEPATSINRNYLKLKSQLIPYLYSVAHDAVNGLPIIRAMFLDEPNSYTLGKATQYQFMCGPWFLVAPIYEETNTDAEGNDIRNNIYLPNGKWIDFFNGNIYRGGKILNNFDAPIWKLPLFVKAGAIIPMTVPNNHINEIPKDLRIYELYPYGHSEFTEYDDDGRTEAYLRGDTMTTHIISDVKDDRLTITLQPALGSFIGVSKEKATILRINVTEHPKTVIAQIGKNKLKLHEVHSKQMFEQAENVYYYDPAPNLNLFSTKGSAAEKVTVSKNPQVLIKIEKTNITTAKTTITIKKFVFHNSVFSKSGPLHAPANAKVADVDRKPYSLAPSWDKTDNTDFYEILYDGMIYTGIRENKLEFTGLEPNKMYNFSVRSVNKTDSSAWVNIMAKTIADPLELAIKGITATCTASSQDGQNPNKLFDFDENDMWHTKWKKKATPFELIADFHSVNTLDKMEYIPRQTGTNGIINSSTIYYSMDKMSWTKADTTLWSTNAAKKTFIFKNHPTARYLKLVVDKASGDFGSGRELYIFKVAGSPSYIPGDINNDHHLDENDITSYMNYTGLRLGDKDFNGYVSNGDINKNNLIDAYDISNVAVALDGNIENTTQTLVSGKIVLVTNKKSYNTGDEIQITARGIDLKSVNGLSFALPYSTAKYEYLGTDLLGVKNMKNFTNDRLHSDGSKVLYPTFVNLGDKPVLNGSQNLFIIRFKALKSGSFTLKMTDGLLVDKNLYSKEF